MFRWQTFFSVVLIVLGIAIFVFLRDRSAEREHQAQIVKIEEIASKTASLRAILPNDLEIVTASASWIRDPDEEDSVTAHHDITIRNTGEGSYVSLWLRLEYVDEGDRPIGSRMFEVSEALPPGSTMRVPGITVDGLPDTVSDFSAVILSADLEGDE